MNFQIEKNRIFKEDENGKVIAEITFPETEKGVFCIDHTFADDSLRGQDLYRGSIKSVRIMVTAMNVKFQGNCDK
ncbi:MAG: hypothetical protein ACI4I9_05715 [Porcipelethomonas sp.]